ncbi:hypothetical protein TNCT_575961 [Trichonephila clavata]|uniref:Uncharacterized protein n=1 Tax=Trichonephila clavata TaxID=2740835 RepID=A0A8X6JIP6_TRICU|nr:hypothetical protein TNCT_575961 [Trichonephila clavata]
MMCTLLLREEKHQLQQQQLQAAARIQMTAIKSQHDLNTCRMDTSSLLSLCDRQEQTITPRCRQLVALLRLSLLPPLKRDEIKADARGSANKSQSGARGGIWPHPTSLFETGRS